MDVLHLLQLSVFNTCFMLHWLVNFRGGPQPLSVSVSECHETYGSVTVSSSYHRDTLPSTSPAIGGEC